MANSQLKLIGFILLILPMITSCEQDEIYLEPIVDFEIRFSDSIVPVNAIFINNSSNLDRFEWNFGDGTTSTDRSPSHLFSKDGTFNIVLKAWKNQEEFSISKSIQLSKVYPYLIKNNSLYKLCNLTAYSPDSSHFKLNQKHGLLNTFETSNESRSLCSSIYLSFDDGMGREFRTAFPFSLESDRINELVIDNRTLIIVNY